MPYIENTTYQCDLLYEATPGSGSFATLGSLFEITPNEISTDHKEKTTLVSANRWKEFTPAAFSDAGEIQAQLRFQATETNTILGLRNLTRNLRLVVNDQDDSTKRSRMDFAGFLTKFGLQTLQVDGDNINTKITLKITGGVTFTPRSA